MLSKVLPLPVVKCGRFQKKKKAFKRTERGHCHSRGEKAHRGGRTASLCQISEKWAARTTSGDNMLGRRFQWGEKKARPKQE